MRRMAIPRSADCGRDDGFMLVELLVAAVVAAVVLTAAFAWVWNVAALAGGADDRAQAATLVAAVSRTVVADLHAAVCVVEPPSGRDPSDSLALVHDHAASAAENVLIVWDPARGVVWRNASGTYVSDHVAEFDIAYVLADGSLVDGGHMGPADWTTVRAARVLITTAVGSATARRSAEASVGPS
jgi:type II secretory pathway component PulJ